MTPPASEPSLRGLRAGVFLGLHGWLLGLAPFCVATGHADLLLEIGATGLAVSVAFAALAVAVLESVLRWRGRGPVFTRMLWGLILLYAGMMTFSFHGWLAPRIDARPELVRALRAVGAVYATAEWVHVGCWIASAVCLLAAARAGREPPSKPR